MRGYERERLVPRKAPSEDTAGGDPSGSDRPGQRILAGAHTEAGCRGYYAEYKEKYCPSLEGKRPDGLWTS